MKSVVITHPATPPNAPQTITIARGTGADAAYTISPMPEGRKLKDENIARRSAIALSFVNAEDVRPASEIKPDSPAVTSEFRRADGLVVRTADGTLTTV